MTESTSPSALYHLLSYLLIGFCSFSLMACASTEEPKSKAHSAAEVSDIFGVDPGMPVREVKKQEFFYKHCSLESRRPYYSAIEYSCNSSGF